MIVNTVIAYYLNSYWSGRMMGYSFKQQVIDILPAFMMAVFVNGIVFIVGKMTTFAPMILLFTQIGLGAILTILTGEIIKQDDYIFLKKLVLEKLITIKRTNNEETK